MISIDLSIERLLRILSNSFEDKLGVKNLMSSNDQVSMFFKKSIRAVFRVISIYDLLIGIKIQHVTDSVVKTV